MLKLILKKKLDVRVWNGLKWLSTVSTGGFLWTGNEPSNSIKGVEVFDYLSDYQLLELFSM
jgi:hypothetical protein